MYARRGLANDVEGSAGMPRIRVEFPDLSIVVEVPGIVVRPVSSPGQRARSPVQDEPATVWVEDLLINGPSSALSV